MGWYWHDILSDLFNLQPVRRVWNDTVGLLQDFKIDFYCQQGNLFIFPEDVEIIQDKIIINAKMVLFLKNRIQYYKKEELKVLYYLQFLLMLLHSLTSPSYKATYLSRTISPQE